MNEENFFKHREHKNAKSNEKVSPVGKVDE